MLHSLTHPAVEYEALRWLESEYPLSEIPHGSTPGAQTLVDVLDVYPEKAEWKHALDASALPDLFPLDKLDKHVDARTPKLRVLFLKDASFLLERSGDNFRFAPGKPTAKWMQECFGVSPLFFKVAALPRRAADQEHICVLRRDPEAENVAKLEGFYQVKDPYRTRRCAVWFSHILGKDRASTYIACNFPEEAKDSITSCSQNCDATLLSRPLSVDLFWFQGVFMILHEIFVGGSNTLAEVEENNQLKSSITPEAAAAAIAALHQSSRELYLLRGRVGDLQGILQFLYATAQKVSRYSFSDIAGDVQTNGEMESTIETLDYLKCQMDYILRREATTHARITTQIAQLFNLSNQLDSRTNLDIARLTSKISISTQRDSSSMITIAILTMFFLPGTFISAFFSMAFIDSTSDEHGRPSVIVGPQIWIYAVVTIILTVLVFCIWGLWHNRRIGQQAKELDVENRAGGVQVPNVTNVVAERPREVTRKLWDRVRDIAGRVQVKFRNRWGAPNADSGAALPLATIAPNQA